MTTLTVGSRVKRNPKDFKPGHRALLRQGTITAHDKMGFRVQWDDEAPSARQYAYWHDELIPA